MNTRIGVWKDDSLGAPGQFEDWRLYMQRVTERGYDAYLLAPWYLNVISYGEDWRNYYLVEPYNFTGKSFVLLVGLGIDACMCMYTYDKFVFQMQRHVIDCTLCFTVGR